MRQLILLLAFLSFVTTVNPQNSSLNPDESIPIPKLNFNSKGELKIVTSTSSSKNDFDFLIGKWRLKHRKLKSRLTNNDEWEVFETVVEDFSILERMGNMDIGHAIIDEKPWEGRTIRLFDPKTKLLSLHWITSWDKCENVRLVPFFLFFILLSIRHIRRIASLTRLVRY